MADSDEDYERRRRDKFRRERNDHQDTTHRRGDFTRNREDWGEERPRDMWRGRGGFKREYGRGDFDKRRGRFENRHGERERESSTAPQAKRIRREGDDPYYGGANHQTYAHMPPYWHDLPVLPPIMPYVLPKLDPDSNTFMSYKQFLLQLDDNLSIEESVEKYNKYKVEFQKNAISEFFKAHKDEEWFRNKYHPEEKIKVNEDKDVKVKNRLKIFMEFLDNGWIEKISLNNEQLKEIVKFMDAVIIKLEGGTDADLQKLEEQYAKGKIAITTINEEDGIENNSAIPQSKDISGSKIATKKRKKSGDHGEGPKEGVNGAGSENEALETTNVDPIGGEKPVRHHHKKDGEKTDAQKSEDGKSLSKAKEGRSSRSSSNSSSCSGSGSSSSTSRSHSAASSISSCSTTTGIKKAQDKTDKKVNDASAKKKANEIEDDSLKSFHKTTSIFLRNLPPNVTKAEVEDLCKNCEGYLRVALADPLPERRFYRRGWITFNNSANVRDICTSLIQRKVKDCEMGPIVNRDITRRVRFINGTVVHAPLALNDLKLAIRCVYVLDSKHHVWDTTSHPTQPDNPRLTGGEDPDNTQKIEERENDGANPDSSTNQAEDTVEDKEAGTKQSNTVTFAMQIDEEIANDKRIQSTIQLIDSLFVLVTQALKLKTPEERAGCRTKLENALIPILDNMENPMIKPILEQLLEHATTLPQLITAPNEGLDSEHGEIDTEPKQLEDGEIDKLETATSNTDINKSEKIIESTGKTVLDDVVKDSNEADVNKSKVVNEPQVVTDVERDAVICKLLDKLIIYLRIVHSLDFYSVSEYPNEDDMPNKCGIIHCRGGLAQAKLLIKDVQEWFQTFQSKIEVFLSPHRLSWDEANALGIRNVETEVEKFIKENTQELSKDKWLCPLSGKKFKGPDFVRKHIFNKHQDKLEIVKKDVDFFNSYLMDSRRPHTQESINSSNSISVIGSLLPLPPTSAMNHHAPPTLGSLNAVSVGGASKPATKSVQGYAPYSSQPDYGAKGYYYPPPPPYGRPGDDRFKRNQRGGYGQREIIQYRDLDAPEEPDTVF